MTQSGGASRRSAGVRGGGSTRRTRRSRLTAAALISTIGLVASACFPEEPGGPPPDIVVTAPVVSVEYGDPIPPLEPSYSVSWTINQQATCTTTATSTSEPGTYPVECAGSAHGSHTFVYIDGAVTITAAPLTITASDTTSTYGDDAPAVSASFTGLKNGETSTATAPVCVSGAGATSDVGSYDNTCSGAVDANYDITYVDGTATVTPAPLTITATSGSTIYGTALVVSPIYDGLVAGDVATSTAPSCVGPTATTGAGAHTTSCTGADDANYDITYVDGAATVDPKSATITASSHAIEAGDALPTVTPSYAGLVNGATSASTAPVCGTDAVDSNTAGSFATFCADADDANYAFDYVDGELVITQGVSPVTVTASSHTVTYGDTIPAITASYVGLGEGIDEPQTPAVCSTTATAGSPAGSYPTVCSGADDEAHEFFYVAGTVTIDPAPLTVTASSANVTFGDAIPAITADYDGLVNGDLAPATLAECSTAANASSDAGTYASLCSGVVDPNYTVTYVPGVVSIDKAAATITADDASHTYGSAATVGFTTAGLLGGQTAPTGAPVCVSTSTATSNVGSGFVTSCSGATDPNYTFDYVDGVATVTPAPLTITGGGSATTSDTELVAVPVYSGLVAGDTETAVAPTCTTTATPGSLGSYPATCSGAIDDNYDITYVEGQFSIVVRSYGTYRPDSSSTTTTGAVNLTTGTNNLNVVSGTGAGFASWTNLTVVSATGPQPVYCNSAEAARFSNCSALGSISIPAGAYVTDAMEFQYDVFTEFPGGAAALEASSLTILQDAPEAFRGHPSQVIVSGGKGLISYLQTPEATGTFAISYGVCASGITTFDPENPDCFPGEIQFSEATPQMMGARVTVIGQSSDIRQFIYQGVTAPASVEAGEEFDIYVATTPTGVPRRSTNGSSTATVNYSHSGTFIYPIPAGTEFVSATVAGGDTRTGGVVSPQFCPGGSGCDASTSGNFVHTTTPYVKVMVPNNTAQRVPGGSFSTSPTLKLRLKATGEPGDSIKLQMTQQRAITNATLIISVNPDFRGYPTTPGTGNPPLGTPVDFTNISIQ